MLEVETIVNGPLEENCHLLCSGGEVLVVDPGSDADRILGVIDGRPVVSIVCTHYHWDHVGAVAALQDALGTGLAIGELDADRLDGVSSMEGRDIALGHPPAHVTRRLADGDVLSVGDAEFRVISTPGHSPGSICLWCASENLLVAGDTLFSGGRFGRTDFPDGDPRAIVESISGKLSRLPDATRVLSGHGPDSTIGAERRLNPYLAPLG